MKRIQLKMSNFTTWTSLFSTRTKNYVFFDDSFQVKKTFVFEFLVAGSIPTRVRYHGKCALICLSGSDVLPDDLPGTHDAILRIFLTWGLKSIFLSIHPATYPSVHPCVCPPIHHPSFLYPSIWPSIFRPSIRPSILLISIHLSPCSSVHPSTQEKTHPFTCLFVHLSIWTSNHISIHLPNYPSIHIFIYPPTSPSIQPVGWTHLNSLDQRKWTLVPLWTFSRTVHLSVNTNLRGD